MKYRFKHPYHITGEPVYFLFIHKWDRKHYETADFVKEKLQDKIAHAFEHYDCCVVDVDVIHSDEVIMCCAGCRYQYIYFDTAEYSNDEIWYPISRYHPQQIKERVKLTIDK